MSRSAQDLLEERRQNVLEQSHEDDPIARQMLQAHIDHLDDLIAEADDAYHRDAPWDIETLGTHSVDRDLGPEER